MSALEVSLWRYQIKPLHEWAFSEICIFCLSLPDSDTALNFLSRSNWLRREKRFICLFGMIILKFLRYLNLQSFNPKRVSIFITHFSPIPMKEFHHFFRKSEKIARRFSSLRYILFVICENLSYFCIAGEGWDLHLPHLLPNKFSSCSWKSLSSLSCTIRQWGRARKYRGKIEEEKSM